MSTSDAVNKLRTNMKNEILQRAMIAVLSTLLGAGIGGWLNNLRWSGIVDTQLTYLRQDMARVIALEPRIVRLEAQTEKHEDEISRLRGRLGAIETVTGVPHIVDGSRRGDK